MGRARKAGTGKVSARGKGRPPVTAQPARGTAAREADNQAEPQPHEVYAADGGEDRLVRRRDLENVGVRDYEVDEIDEEDDEEIDSDDAFDASDEEQFAGLRRTAASAVGRAAQADDGEESDASADDMEEEGEEDDEDGSLVDLSEMLDASDSGDEAPAGGDMGVSGLSLEGGQESSDEDEAFAGFDDQSGSGADGSDDDDEGDDAAKLSKLDGFVTSISARAPKRRFVAEAGVGFVEDENAVGSGMHARGVTLGLDDLLGDAAPAADAGGEDKAARELRLLKDRVRTMEKAAKRAGSGVVGAPVPKRMQEQMDRTVAYTQTKAAVSEWQPAVNANRKAEHLSFPLREGGKPSVTTNTLVGTAPAANDMEAKVQAILAQSGMSDEQQRQYEELEMKQLSPEEIRHRQRELRLVRELMFRSEQKAKRTAKIKSKTYRRILKRQKTHAQEKELERMKDDDPEMYSMLMEKMAQGRAEERMTLRHKNTGKWAKAMAKRAHGDADAQQAVREQLAQHDQLKRKIYDIGSDEELSDYEAGKELREGQDSDSDAGDTFAATKSRAVAKLTAEIDNHDDVIPDDAPHKSLFEMKFMKSAMQRKREQAVRDAEAMRDEIAGLEAHVDADGHALSVKRPAKPRADDSATTPGAPGRMSFGGGLAKRDAQAPAATSDDDQADHDTAAKRVRLDEAGQVGQVSSGAGHRVRLDGPMSVKSPTGKQARRPAGHADDEDGASNPWLDGGVDASASRRGGDAAGVSKESAKIDKLTARLREKRQAAGGAARRAEDAVLLDVSKTLAMDTSVAHDDSDGEAGSDTEGIHLEPAGARGPQRHPHAFSQRAFVEQAFAEDSVVDAEFAAEKAAAMDLDAPKDEDLTLPGWGGWGGSGIQPKKNKVVRKAAAGSGVEKAKRLDAKLGSVIINQRQPKTANKYYAANVPFPFFTAKQYEATMQVPMGKEWNTTKAHSSFIKPRIMTKAGQIIDPLSIPTKKIQ